MPVFEGWNLEGWIFQVELYFHDNHLTEIEKLAAATINLEGEALAWFQWEDGRRSMRSLVELKVCLLDRFRQTQEGSLCEQFLATTLDDVPEHVQESTFINCLKPDIRAEVRMMKLEGLREIMKFA